VFGDLLNAARQHRYLCLRAANIGLVRLRQGDRLCFVICCNHQGQIVPELGTAFNPLPRLIRYTGFMNHPQLTRSRVAATGIVLAACLAMGAFIYFILPTNTPEQAAQTFMDYASTGNTEEALKLTAAGTQQTKQKIEQQLPLRSHSFSQHRLTRTGDTAYVVYRLGDGQSKYAHLDMMSVKNQWRVKDFSVKDTAD
jgi:hypothetical protein